MIAAGAVVAIALLAAVGPCGSDSVARIDPGQLRRVVLQPEDVPDVFVRFDDGPIARADVPPGPRGDPERFGREDGWKARYRRPGSPRTPGALVIESRIDLFGDEEGAQRDLAAYTGEFKRDGELLEPPEIGDESVAVTFVQTGGLRKVRFFRLAWRHRNLTASLLVEGFEGKIRFDDALGLARKQQQRIEEAG